MRLSKIIFLISFTVFLNHCSKPALNVAECNNFKKTSKEYIACMSKEINSTNIVNNSKEFKKHKTLKSFFKQVEVVPSN